MVIVWMCVSTNIHQRVKLSLVRLDKHTSTGKTVHIVSNWLKVLNTRLILCKQEVKTCIYVTSLTFLRAQLKRINVLVCKFSGLQTCRCMTFAYLKGPVEIQLTSFYYTLKLINQSAFGFVFLQLIYSKHQLMTLLSDVTTSRKHTRAERPNVKWRQMPERLHFK